MVFTIFFTILPLILMLFPQKKRFSSIFCSYFHLILTLIWKNLHGLAKNHKKHMGFSSISPYFNLILTLICLYFEVIFRNLGVCKNHGFYHIFFIILSLILMLFPEKTHSKTIVFSMSCSYFHLILTLMWKNLYGLAKKPSKTHGFFID